MRSSFRELEFIPELNIELKISLNSFLSFQLIEYVANPKDTAEYLLKLSEEQPNHPLLFTENWLLLSARQTCEDGERGYRTLWDYLSPTTLAQAAENGVEDPVSDALASFFKDWSQNNLFTVTEKATAEVVDGIAHFFKGFADFNLDEITKLIQEFDLALAKDWKAPQAKTILQQLLNFFTEDDWGFTKLQGESVLQLAFQGQNGQWACYAQAREEKNQFVFYSVCPAGTPEEKRSEIAHFLTRANYGMTIGNFELDFNDGEIRYKTSIDVEGDRLSPALIKRIIYINVAMMDEYLQGIKAVIEQGVSPEAAIRAIEQSDDTVPTEENV